MKTNYQIGHDAEQRAATYLAKAGFTILAVNWKTKWCEIDIVARHDETIYFIEVKYRKNTTFGSGLDYITPAKLRRMQFASDMWVSSESYSGSYQLAALAIDGDQFTFVDQL